MPELPEVEAARKAALRHLRGRRIVEARCSPDAIVLSGVSPRRIENALRGASIEDAGRFGKHLWLELDRTPWPVFHFGMTGGFHFLPAAADSPRFLKLELTLDDHRRFAFTDARRFGRLRLAHDPRNEPPLSELGHDPFFGLPEVGDLVLQIGRRQAPIKAVLLDQATFAGVGNWIADEVLYQAGIRPQRPASDLSKAEISRLRGTLLRVIRRAVAVNADSDRFPAGWLFHRRWGRVKNSKMPDGAAIVHDTVGGRTTAWVPSRQR
ncbi:MAG TPA: DNA-formamidopyrimidine glycosylase family protein [Vicinamibacteria bacterium]|nr:DNA-formamidopyrimidine glycosylase family protein [Vicinamibacteria bacterium]